MAFWTRLSLTILTKNGSVCEETNRGCPFQCTFCDWGSATAAKVTKFEQERLDAELQWMADRKIQYVFVCDANFGIQKRDVEIAESVAKIKQKTGYPHGFSVQIPKMLPKEHI